MIPSKLRSQIVAALILRCKIQYDRHGFPTWQSRKDTSLPLTTQILKNLGLNEGKVEQIIQELKENCSCDEDVLMQLDFLSKTSLVKELRRFREERRAA